MLHAEFILLFLKILRNLIDNLYEFSAAQKNKCDEIILSQKKKKVMKLYMTRLLCYLESKTRAIASNGRWGIVSFLIWDIP